MENPERRAEETVSTPPEETPEGQKAERKRMKAEQKAERKWMKAEQKAERKRMKAEYKRLQKLMRPWYWFLKLIGWTAILAVIATAYFKPEFLRPAIRYAANTRLGQMVVQEVVLSDSDPFYKYLWAHNIPGGVGDRLDNIERQIVAMPDSNSLTALKTQVEALPNSEEFKKLKDSFASLESELAGLTGENGRVKALEEQLAALNTQVAQLLTKSTMPAPATPPVPAKSSSTVNPPAQPAPTKPTTPANQIP